MRTRSDLNFEHFNIISSHYQKSGLREAARREVTLLDKDLDSDYNNITDLRMELVYATTISSDMELSSFIEANA